MVGRVLCDARRAQGFKSQAHLDAWYVHYDHFNNCPGCNKPGPSVLTDDGWQGTVTECEEGLRLFRASFRENFTAE